MFVHFASNPAFVPIAEVLRTAPDVTVAAQTTSEIAPLEKKRAVIAVQNLSNHRVRIGDGNVGPTQGAELSAREYVTLNTSAAIFCHNPSTNDATLSIIFLEI